jgi:hypothetical protein
MAALLPDGSSSKNDHDDCHDEIRDLRAALRTRPVIDQAKGLLIAKHAPFKGSPRRPSVRTASCAT